MKSPKDESVATRRVLLKAFPAFLALATAPRSAVSQKQKLLSTPLTLNLADSLAIYRYLTEAAQNEAIRKLGRFVAARADMCEDLLRALNASLSEITRILNSRSDAATLSSFREPAELLRTGITDLRRSAVGSYYEVDALAALSRINLALLDLVDQTRANCIPDPDGSIRKILSQMINKIQEHQQAAAKLTQDNHTFTILYEARLRKIIEAMKDCSSEIINASVLVRTLYETESSDVRAKISSHLQNALDQLVSIQHTTFASDLTQYQSAEVEMPIVGETPLTAIQGLKELLEGYKKSLEQQRRTSTSPGFDGYPVGDGPTSSPSEYGTLEEFRYDDAYSAEAKEILKNKVIVEPYFHPPTALDAPWCICCCLGVSWLFPTSRETRKMLILTFLYHTPDKCNLDRSFADEVADKLADLVF